MYFYSLMHDHPLLHHRQHTSSHNKSPCCTRVLLKRVCMYTTLYHRFFPMPTSLPTASKRAGKLPTTLANHNRYVTTPTTLPVCRSPLPLIQCKKSHPQVKVV
jgi:hypothetical protein